MTSKISKSLITVFLFIGCKAKAPVLSIDQTVASTYFNAERRIIVLSCVRCRCFVDALNNAWKTDSDYLKSVAVYADTTCTKLVFPVKHISQSNIDNLSSDLYNVILLKKTDNKYDFRIVQTKENHRFINLYTQFFRKID
jgi:hypothetical protein